jgi:hypothetical protein
MSFKRSDTDRGFFYNTKVKTFTEMSQEQKRQYENALEEDRKQEGRLAYQEIMKKESERSKDESKQAIKTNEVYLFHEEQKVRFLLIDCVRTLANYSDSW